jgi:tetratricopeptide (TPR) repeat protein
MYSIAFWKIWPPVYQRLLAGAIGLFILSQGFLWISNFRSPAPVFEQQHFQQLEPLEIPVHRFQQGTTPLTISTDAYLVFEHIFGSPLKPNLIASYFFLVLLLAGIVFILTVLTTLTRFWFFMGMGLFILIVESFRLDALGLFGLTNQMPVVLVLAVYGFAGYYFQFIRPGTPFFKRWAALAVITLALGTGILFLARIHEPFLYLAANGLIAGTILTIVFIFMVAHEIVASFIFVVTRGTKQKKSLQHFLIITTIYLVNLALLYADKKHVVEWDFFPFSLFLLITVSGVLGVWGFRRREPQYESLFKADPYGVYFFVALAGIGFGTMGYFLASANDPGIQLFQDAILYSHLGYGLIFFIYIIVNFLSLLGGNLQVHKVLYKPTVMPYFTFRFAGLITTFAFFAYSNWKVSVNQAYASYYNAMGDFHLSQDTSLLAEGYYQRSVFFATRNYHAHYALAQLFGARQEYDKEKQEYTRLVDGRPLDLAYLNLSQLYASDNSVTESALVLKQGLVDFPKNGPLQNALSLVDSRLGLRDSALLLANAARNSFRTKGVAETNLVGFTAKFLLRFPADSMMDLLNSNHPGVKSDILALAASQEKSVPVNVDPGSDTVLTVYSSTALNNYLINPLNPVDTSLVSKTVRLARKPSNSYFKNFLLSAAAHAYYRNGQTADAFKLMHEIAFLGQQSKYYNTLGLWAMEQGATENAVHFLGEAVRLNGSTSYFNRAVALTEAGDRIEAVTAWDSLRRSGDPQIQKKAETMIVLLKATPQQARSFDNEAKFEFSRHGFSADQGGAFEKLVNTITDQGVRARAVVDRTKQLEETDDTGLALAAFALVKGLQLSDKTCYEEILHLNLRFLAKQKLWSLLEQQLHSGIQFEGVYRQDKLYFDALLSEQAGKKEEAAQKFAWLATVNPFFEDAVVAAIRFFNKNGEDKVKTYTLLMNALDQNPNSIKLLKAYIVQSAYVGFEESAQDALDKLKNLVHPSAFARFLDENPEIFEVARN